jgi:RNA-directed DNA polymerase
MAQRFAYPKTETELQRILDNMYRYSQSTMEKGETPKIKGLYEIITSEPVILTAIHNIKANKGSETPGIDGETVRQNILERKYPRV